MLDYLRSSLDWTAEKPYEIFGNVGGWKWDVTNDHVNLSPDLAGAISTNPHLKVLVMCGHTDLATPAPGIEYSVRHLGLPAELRGNIGFAYYDAGHMFYLNPPDRAKMRKDLVEFLNDAR
jgi:carboxypeptidase C (cathepsin A)